MPRKKTWRNKKNLIVYSFFYLLYSPTHSHSPSLSISFLRLNLSSIQADIFFFFEVWRHIVVKCFILLLQLLCVQVNISFEFRSFFSHPYLTSRVTQSHTHTHNDTLYEFLLGFNFFKNDLLEFIALYITTLRLQSVWLRFSLEWRMIWSEPIKIHVIRDSSRNI